MTSTIKYNLDLLEDARLAATKASGRIGTVGDQLGRVHVAASSFGTTPGASALAHAVSSLFADAGTQCTKGESLLRSVGRAVDGVMTAIEDADRAGKQSFDAGTSHTGGSVRTFDGGTSPAAASGGGSDGGSGGGAVRHSGGMAPPVDPGTGVTVNLPGKLGSVEAPNEQAAGAVRAALTQLGVPYVFGADSPKAGFDCSGLTEWAYGKEGVKLEHFAAHQDVGQQVSRENLAPGDLVVWQGHVNMYIGHGQVVEAPQTGDVVHVVPLYTNNPGDPFIGFYRPTAR